LKQTAKRCNVGAIEAEPRPVIDHFKESLPLGMGDWFVLKAVDE